MNIPARLGVYALGLAVAFAAAAGVGVAVGPVRPAASDTHDEPHRTGGGDTMQGHDTSGAPQPAAGIPAGLAVSQDGYTVVPQQGVLPAGRPTEFRFTVAGPDGEPVTRYAQEHDKDLHLIVVRRDLSGFQHLHPTLGPAGVWSQRLTLPAAGTYRAFADFVPAGGRPLTLGVDLHATGGYAPRPLPAPSRTATVDGYAVTLTGQLRAGQSSPLTLSVRKDGRPVTDLQPYLAAYGHLVALRAGDLAYLHVHPEGHPGDGTTPAGPDIRFTAEVPTTGTYRLYLDFQHAGVVRTAEFTATAAGAGQTPTTPDGAGGAPPTGTPTPAPSSGGHPDDGHGHP